MGILAPRGLCHVKSPPDKDIRAQSDNPGSSPHCKTLDSIAAARPSGQQLHSGHGAASHPHTAAPLAAPGNCVQGLPSRDLSQASRALSVWGSLSIGFADDRHFCHTFFLPMRIPDLLEGHQLPSGRVGGDECPRSWTLGSVSFDLVSKHTFCWV